MKPTTLFGTLVLLITWSSVGATEAGTYSIQKADNSVEQRITAAQSDDSWPLLFIPKSHKPTDIAAWVTVAIDVAGSTAGEVAVVSLILEAVAGVMVMVVILGIGEALSHYLPIDHLPRQKRCFYYLSRAGNTQDSHN
mgnify:CR=1 FL=1